MEEALLLALGPPSAYSPSPRPGLAEHLGPRLVALALSVEAAGLRPPDLALLAAQAPGLTDLALAWDAGEQPAPDLAPLAALAGLRRLAVALTCSRLNFVSPPGCSRA